MVGISAEIDFSFVRKIKRNFFLDVSLTSDWRLRPALTDCIEVIVAITCIDFVDRLVQARQNFDRIDRQLLIVDPWHGIARTMHLPKASSVPEFGREVAPLFDLLFIESNVLAAWRNAHEAKTQPVGAVLLDQLQRVGRVAERLRHFAALLITNQAREENIVKWNVVFITFGFARLELETRDNHSRHPEKNNVRRGHQHAGWVEFLPGLFIHRLISPEPR